MVGQQPKMGGQAEGLHFINQGRFKKKYMWDQVLCILRIYDIIQFNQNE